MPEASGQPWGRAESVWVLAWVRCTCSLECSCQMGVRFSFWAVLARGWSSPTLRLATGMAKTPTESAHSRLSRSPSSARSASSSSCFRLSRRMSAAPMRSTCCEGMPDAATAVL